MPLINLRHLLFGPLAVLLAAMLLSAAQAFAQPAASDLDQQKWRATLDAPAPTSGRQQDIAEIYLQRATAARVLEDPERELAELQAGLGILGTTRTSQRLWWRLAGYYVDRGNSAKAAAAYESQLKSATNPNERLWALSLVTASKASLYDLTGARESLKQMRDIQTKLRNSTSWPQYRHMWQAQFSWAQAAVSFSSGHLADRTAALHACLGSITQYFGGTPRVDAPYAFYVADCSSNLLSGLLAQGNLAEAGAIAAQYRDFVTSFAASQYRPEYVSRVASNYVALAMEQGRFNDARQLAQSTMTQLLQARAAESSTHIARMRSILARIEMVEGNWAQAQEIHLARRDGLRSDADGGLIPRSTSDWTYTLVRVGRAREAVEMARGIILRVTERADDNSITLWENRSFLGIALAATGERDAALKELSLAVPRYLQLVNGERSSAEAGIVRSKRLSWILDGYIALLSDIARSGSAPTFSAMDEAFRMADLARGSTVQRALAASASRASIADPALAELVRREQDLQREISALADAMGNLLSRGRIKEQDGIVADMRANLVKLRAQHAQLLGQLGRRYPDYASLIDPRPLGIADIQKALKPHEAMVSIYVGSERTLVWAIPARGEPRLHVAALDEKAIAGRVRRLRHALDPTEGLPRYDFDTAHTLYEQLLEPMAAAWRDARELIIVPHGALGSLPFPVLTTAPFTPGQDARFADYANAPWLVKQVAVSQLPAALALAALRGKAQTNRTSLPFVGFGDPVFASSVGTPQLAANRSLARRNLQIAASERQRQDIGVQADLTLLQPLPDTADEINQIAAVLRADPARDVFLQQRASESNVKKYDMSAYRVVMFATHGLVPGEMPGLYQPALALSNPKITGEPEDGLLTMEEILSLKLSADWVVLSACNTASAAGEGSEAVSGLGRAFFYAGAKALLVSSWPVETVSARLLTTEIFRRQTEAPAASRTSLLRDASLDLMQRGTPDYSYAHPMFWAPFVLVGDGG